MEPNLLKTFIFSIVISCTCPIRPRKINSTVSLAGNRNPYETIGSIPLPAGYFRIKSDPGSFANWLQGFTLKDDKTVFYFDGSQKPNQSAQFAVLNLTTGKKDLQQCADAIMRLRAEFLYSQKRYSEISFSDNNNKAYTLEDNAGRSFFDKYLENIFTRCGTLSLEKQLRKVDNWAALLPGDVFIKGGSPGHAALIIDVASNKEGKKIFLIANGYMPAQDMHIVINPRNADLSPWFAVDSSFFIQLPEWIFTANQLRKW